MLDVFPLVFDTIENYGGEQTWADHLREERDWFCNRCGFVRSGGRQHGGRAHSHQCARCGSTVRSVDVDWAAYHRARENDERPPCPSCGSEEIEEIPAKPKYVCNECSHQYGTAAGYY